MSYLFVFPYDLEDITKDKNIPQQDPEFVNSLRTRVTTEQDNFSFSQQILDSLIQVINQQEQKQSISVSLLKTIIQINELAKKSLGLLKELGREWKNGRRSYYFQHLTTIRIAVFLNCQFGQSLFIQQKSNQNKMNKLPEHEIAKIKTLKRQRFQALQDIIKDFGVIWKLEGPDYNMVKNIFTLMFVFIKEFELYQKSIWETLQILMEFAGNEKNKFISLFIISLEDWEGGEQETFKESEFKARILSELVVSDKNHCVQVSSELLEKLIITVQNKKGSENDFLKNSKAFFMELIKLQPGYAFRNLPLFRALYSSESFMIRNAITESSFYILNYLHNNQSIETNENIGSFEIIFQMICWRESDKNSFCRNSALKVLSQIFKDIPLGLEEQLKILQIIYQRVFDISFLVRKRALSTLSAIMFHYKSLVEQQLENEQLIQQYEQNHQENASTDQKARFLNAKIKIQIVQLLKDSHEKVKSLLHSKVDSDVHESLKVICTACLISIKEYQALLYQSFDLIYSQEQGIKDKVIQMFFALLIANTDANENSIVKNLIQVWTQLNFDQKTAFEEILKILFERGSNKSQQNQQAQNQQGVFHLDESLQPFLWQHFENHFSKNECEESIGALRVLKISLEFSQIWIEKNIKRIFELFKGFLTQKYIDFQVLSLLVEIFIVCKSYLNSENQDTALKTLVYFLLKNQGCYDTNYFKVAENVIFLAFVLRNDPEKFSEFLIKWFSSFINQQGEVWSSENLFPQVQEEHNFEMTQMVGRTKSKCKLDDNDQMLNQQKLIHLIFVSGEIALKFLYFFEKIDKQLQQNKNQLMKSEMQDELQRALGGVEAEYEKQKNEFQQALNSLFQPDTLLYQFYALAKNIVQECLEDSTLKEHSLLIACLNSIIKFMLVNKSLAQDFLPELYQLLQNKETSDQVKQIVIVGLGDLFHQYPQMINRDIQKLLECLNIQNQQLQSTALSVLTHLILNDYLKLKSEVYFFVNLLLEDNQELVESVKMFFWEVNNKNPEFLNNTFPEVVAKLSLDENQGGISEMQFEKISHEILQFLDKEKSIDEISDSLMINLRNSQNEWEIRNILVSLNQLTKSEKVMQNIINQAEVFKLKIEVPNAEPLINLIFKKIKRNPKIQKSQIHEFEKIVFQRLEDGQQINLDHIRFNQGGKRKKKNWKFETIDLNEDSQGEMLN